MASSVAHGAVNIPQKLRAANPTVPVRLLTPMKVQAETTLSVISAQPIRITQKNAQPIYILSDTPVTVFSENVLKLEPTLVLSQDFARGWFRLPDELKLRVLTFNLTGSLPIAQSYFQRGWTGVKPNVVTRYFTHLRLPPDMAALAREAFYSVNEFQLGLRSAMGGERLLPSVTARHLIRRLKLIVRPSGDDWARIISVANGELFFSALKFVTIVIWLRNPPSIFRVDREHARMFGLSGRAKEITAEAVSFPCLGRIDFEHTWSSWKVNQTQEEQQEEDKIMREWFKSKIVFAS